MRPLHHPSDENSDSNNERNHLDPAKHKSKSMWDLSEKDKERAEKKKKKRKKSIQALQQGLLELINIGDPAVSGDNTALKSLAKSKTQNNHEVSDKGSIEMCELPSGKKVLEAEIDIDVDTAFKKMYEDDNFFSRNTEECEGEVQNFSVSKWEPNEQNHLCRKMHYEFPKTVAFTKYTVVTDQVQTRCAWCTPGTSYGIDVVSRTSGIMYADTFHIDLHIRLEAKEKKTKFTAIANIVFDKSCLFKSKVETETLNGMKKYYTIVVKNLSTGEKSKSVKESKSKDGTSRTSRKKNLPSSVVYAFNERTILIAFVLVIITLLIITIAMFKLAGSISSLSERLYKLEYLLEQCAHSHCSDQFK